MNSIFIIGGGYSLTGFNFKQLKNKGLIIGIKDVFLYTYCDIGLNMDRIWYEQRYDKLVQSNKQWYIRRNCLKDVNKPLLDTWNMFDNNPYSNIFSDDKNTLNGSNSGFCALNLAYHMKPKEIYLLGFDMGKTKEHCYWYPFYEYMESKSIKHDKYVNWGKEFDIANKQCLEKNIIVYNVNPNNSIPDVKHIKLKDFKI